MIILTGSDGFIGKHFQTMCSYDGLVEVNADNCFNFLENFKEWDKVSMIIHQGALSSTTNINIDAIYKYNIVFSIELFKKAIKHKIPVKYASSASVYGTEKDKINPLNYYALSKTTVDYWVMDNIDEFEHIQGFRYFNVYGSGEESKGLMASLVSQFWWQARATGLVHPFEGSDEVLRDYVWVGDVVKIVLQNTAGSGIFDLGTGQPTSVDTVARLISLKTGSSLVPIPFPPHLKGKYQYYTIADMDWLKDYNFLTVKEYIDRLNLPGHSLVN